MPAPLPTGPRGNAQGHQRAFYEQRARSADGIEQGAFSAKTPASEAKDRRSQVFLDRSDAPIPPPAPAMERSPPKHHIQRNLLPVKHPVELQLRPRGGKFGQRQAVLAKGVENRILNAQGRKASVAKLIMDPVKA